MSYPTPNYTNNDFTSRQDKNNNNINNNNNNNGNSVSTKQWREVPTINATELIPLDYVKEKEERMLALTMNDTISNSNNNNNNSTSFPQRMPTSPSNLQQNQHYLNHSVQSQDYADIKQSTNNNNNNHNNHAKSTSFLSTTACGLTVIQRHNNNNHDNVNDNNHYNMSQQQQQKLQQQRNWIPNSSYSVPYQHDEPNKKQEDWRLALTANNNDSDDDKNGNNHHHNTDHHFGGHSFNEEEYGGFIALQPPKIMSNSSTSAKNNDKKTSSMMGSNLSQNTHLQQRQEKEKEDWRITLLANNSNDSDDEQRFIPLQPPRRENTTTTVPTNDSNGRTSNIQNYHSVQSSPIRSNSAPSSQPSSSNNDLLPSTQQSAKSQTSNNRRLHHQESGKYNSITRNEVNPTQHSFLVQSSSHDMEKEKQDWRLTLTSRDAGTDSDDDYDNNPGFIPLTPSIRVTSMDAFPPIPNTNAADSIRTSNSTTTKCTMHHSVGNNNDNNINSMIKNNESNQRHYSCPLPSSSHDMKKEKQDWRLALTSRGTGTDSDDDYDDNPGFIPLTPLIRTTSIDALPPVPNDAEPDRAKSVRGTNSMTTIPTIVHSNDIPGRYSEKTKKEQQQTQERRDSSTSIDDIINGEHFSSYHQQHTSGNAYYDIDNEHPTKSSFSRLQESSTSAQGTINSLDSKRSAIENLPVLHRPGAIRVVGVNQSRDDALLDDFDNGLSTEFSKDFTMNQDKAIKQDNDAHKLNNDIEQNKTKKQLPTADNHHVVEPKLSTSSSSSRSKSFVILICIILLVTIGIVVGVVIAVGGNKDSGNDNNNNNSNPQQNQTKLSDNPLFQEQLQNLRQIVINNEWSLKERFDNEESPQSYATIRLTEYTYDSSVESSSSVTMSLYVLTVLFYALNGPTWPSSSAIWINSPNDAFNVCSWDYITCNKNNDIIDLNLPAGLNGFDATLPQEMFLLTNLLHLWIPNNNLIDMEEPDNSEMLPNLLSLELSDNSFQRNLPDWIYQMTELEYLYLYRCGFTGTLSPDVGGFKNLIDFAISENSLTGDIPSEIGFMTNLLLLDVTGSSFDGTIPFEIGDLTALETLKLASSGEIPTSLGNLSELQNLFLTGGFNSKFGSWIGALTKLRDFQLRDAARLSGSIPTEIGYLTMLTSIQIATTNINGPIPSEVGNLNALKNLLITDSFLTGTLPTRLGQLSQLVKWDFQGSEFSGTVPTEIGYMSSLVEGRFAFDSEEFGPIPSEIGNLNKLEHFEIKPLSAEVTVPYEVCDLPSLVSWCVATEQNMCDVLCSPNKIILPAN